MWMAVGKHDRFASLTLSRPLRDDGGSFDRRCPRRRTGEGPDPRDLQIPGPFQPVLRAAIDTFTQRRDLVLDPHVGGGTTLVEALALAGMPSASTSASSPSSSQGEDDDLPRQSSTSSRLGEARRHAIDIHGATDPFRRLCRARLLQASRPSVAVAPAEGDRAGHLVAQSSSARRVWNPSADAPCSGPRSGPSTAAASRPASTTSAPTSKPPPPAWSKVRAHSAPRSGATDRTGAKSKCSIAALPASKTIRATAGWRAPRLVVTSPPYPGVHVLYHRWQVDGRKETALPFMIAQQARWRGVSQYYTMGDRKYPELKTYFDNIRLDDVVGGGDGGRTHRSWCRWWRSPNRNGNCRVISKPWSRPD